MYPGEGALIREERIYVEALFAAGMFRLLSSL